MSTPETDHTPPNLVGKVMPVHEAGKQVAAAYRSGLADARKQIAERVEAAWFARYDAGDTAEDSPVLAAFVEVQQIIRDLSRPSIDRDLWGGYLCPAMANIGALKQAQSDLIAIGTDWAEAGRILSRVQRFYVDAAHEAAQRYVAEQACRPGSPGQDA